MKKFNSAKTAFILLSMMTFASASGAVGGTLAWYAYSTRALVSYSGTSVSETSLLQVGICSDVKITNFPNSIEEVRFAGDSNYYYFSESGKGLTYDIISKYLEKKGYATNELEPTTSGTFVSGSNQDDFSLKQAPNEMVYGNTIEAKKKDFVEIPFVFRVKGAEENQYYDNVELWLTKTIAKASSDADGDVYKAIRIFVDRDSRKYGTDFILNPSANSVGKTKVGGVLNIAHDEYYDFDTFGEILYGEYDPAALDLISDTGYAGTDEVTDVNGVGSDEPSTFVAKHRPGNKYYSNLSGAANDALFKHAEYECISSIAPVRDSHDYISNYDPSNPTSVCETRADDNHLGRVTMTVYLEGWDFAVIDEEIAHSFDLGLTFEMSRL